MLEIAAAAFLIMIASLAGVISVWRRAGEIIERNLVFLVSFSAGVFLAITYRLLRETVEHSETLASGALWIIVGIAAIWLLFRFLPDFHHHHHEGEDHPHSTLDARRILLSDAIHNVGDGILLAASFSVSTVLGMVTTLSIFIHELVQETSEFFVLREAGFSTKRALFLNFAVSVTILIGALGGFYLVSESEFLEGPLLGIAAGSFFVVVLNDLIPHSVRAARNRTDYLKHFLWFSLGALVMFLVSLLAGH